jgi:hypothetical protein
MPYVVKLSGCHHSQSVTWPRAQKMGGTVELILEFLFQSDLNSIFMGIKQFFFFYKFQNGRFSKWLFFKIANSQIFFVKI